MFPYLLVLLADFGGILPPLPFLLLRNYWLVGLIMVESLKKLLLLISTTVAVWSSLAPLKMIFFEGFLAIILF